MVRKSSGPDRCIYICNIRDAFFSICEARSVPGDRRGVSIRYTYSYTHSHYKMYAIAYSRACIRVVYSSGAALIKNLILTAE